MSARRLGPGLPARWALGPALAGLALAGLAPFGLAPAALAGAPAARTAAAPPAAVRRASEQFARDAAGVVAYLAVAESTLDAPMFKRRFGARLWVANLDGRPTRARALAFFVDGQPASEAERAKHERETNAAYRARERGFDAPYDARHLADYAINAAACVGCEPGVQAFDFRSDRKDPAHGIGTFWLDASQHVTRVSYRPTVLPKGASSAELELLRGPVPGVGWSLRRVRARFTGGIGPVTGSYTLEQHVSGHRRFASVEQAMAAAPK